MAEDTKQSESRDQLKPSAVHEQLRVHDKHMREIREELALAKASYMTRFWSHVSQAVRVTSTLRSTGCGR